MAGFAGADDTNVRVFVVCRRIPETPQVGEYPITSATTSVLM